MTAGVRTDPTHLLYPRLLYLPACLSDLELWLDMTGSDTYF